MRITLLFLAVAALALSQEEAPRTGRIKGIATFKGDPPKPEKLDTSSDKVCCDHGDVYGEEVVVRDGKLKNVLVHVSKGIKGKFKPPDEPVKLDQKGCVFQPHVVAAMRGQKIVIRNSDPTSHNVHIKPRMNEEDNFSQPKQGQESVRTFFFPEIGIPIVCDVHPWMKSYLHIMKHPFYAITGEDGAFEIGEVPPGSYTLETWHEKYGRKSAEVTVEAGKEAAVNFEFP